MQTVHIFWVNLSQVIYLITVVSVGFTFSISTAVHDFKDPLLSSYCEGYLIYMYLLGIIVLFYLLKATRQHIASTKAGDEKTIFSNRKFNLHVRLGVAIFFFGSITLRTIRIYEMLEQKLRFNCQSFQLCEIILYFLQIIFSFMQTLFLFKYHQVSITVCQHWTIRFSYIHLIALNLTCWIFSIVTEALELHDHHLLHKKNSSITLSGRRSRQCIEEPTEIAILKRPNHNDNNNNSNKHRVSLSTSASPFLFPCISEFSALCMGMIMSLYLRHKWHTLSQTKNLSLQLQQQQQQCNQPPPPPPPAGVAIKMSLGCNKSHFGVFSGLLLSAIFITYSVVCLSQYKTSLRHGNNYYKILLRSGPTLLTILSLLTIFILFIKFTRRLKFVSAAQSEQQMDKWFLWLCFSAFLTYLLFRGIAIINTIITDCCTTESILFAVDWFMSMGEITLQLLFIFDALHRKVGSAKDENEKPGRSLITLLITINFLFWIYNNLRLHFDDMSYVFINFYGILSWCHIVSSLAPFMILYRIHAAMILFDIWNDAFHGLHAIAATDADDNLSKIQNESIEMYTIS